MATTIPTEFAGTPALTAERLTTLKDWYIQNLGDCDKADDIDLANEYAIVAEVMEDVLRLLHGMPLTTEKEI